MVQMNDPLLRFRATGRTYRMLSEAIRIARDGEKVYVVAANKKHIDHLREMLIDMLKDHFGWSVAANITRIGKGEIHLFSAMSDRWDWWSNRIEGTPHDTPVLVDHATFEFVFPQIIRGWTKYNI